MLLSYKGCGRSWYWGPREGGDWGQVLREVQIPFTVLDSSRPPSGASLLPLEHRRHTPASEASVGIPPAWTSSPQHPSAPHIYLPHFKSYYIHTVRSRYLLREALPDHPVIIVIPTPYP